MKSKRQLLALVISICYMGVLLCNATVASAATKTLKLESETLSVVLGQTTNLVVETNTTGARATFKSDNSKIAKVSASGVVTGVKKGIATITVTAGSKKATCVVTVKDTTLTLKTSTASVTVGETITVKVKTNTTGKVPSYMSSDMKIAKVSSKGVVTAIKKGTVTITVTAGSKKVTCIVTVKKSSVILPTGLEFRDYTVFDQGESRDTHATVIPSNATNKSVTYTSSDPDIVTVDNNGIVTGHKEGIAYITAETSNGIKMECEVDVTEYIFRESTQSFPQERDTTLFVAGKSIKLHDSVATLTASYGTPDRIDENEFGGLTYVYNSNYNSLVFVYVNEDKVVGYFTCASRFSCAGVTENSSDNELSEVMDDSITEDSMCFAVITDSYYMTVYKDGHGDKLPYAVFLTDNSFDQERGAEEYLTNPSETLVSNMELESYDIVNGIRVSLGLGSVSYDMRLSTVARNHCQDMIDRNYFDHTSPDGVTFSDRYRIAGIGNSGGGEVIAPLAGEGPIAGTFSFMLSPRHRVILLSERIKYAGAGMSYKGEEEYLTINFSW